MKEKIFNDINQFLKASEKEKVMVLRMVKSAILEQERELKKALDEGAIAQIINKQIKMRKESIEQFKLGNRQDLIEKAEQEMELLKMYLPEQLDEKAINDIIEDAFAKIKPTSSKDIGKIMQDIMPKLKGKADMSFVNKLVRSKLGD